MPSVLIVDDHAAFRAAARAVLRADGFDILAEAADGASALDAARELRPDLVLLDIQLPDRDGFSIAQELAREADAPAVVLISTRTAADYGDQLASASVRGFISKSDLTGEAVSQLLAPP